MNVEEFEAAAEALRRATGNQGEPLTLDELYRIGWLFADMAGRLADLAEEAGRAAEGLPGRFVLRDDQGLDPIRRAGDAQAKLAVIHARFCDAETSASRYHGTMSHLGVEVDPNAKEGGVHAES